MRAALFVVVAPLLRTQCGESSRAMCEERACNAMNSGGGAPYGYAANTRMHARVRETEAGRYVAKRKGRRRQARGREW